MEYQSLSEAEKAGTGGGHLASSNPFSSLRSQDHLLLHRPSRLDHRGRRARRVHLRHAWVESIILNGVWAASCALVGGAQWVWALLCMPCCVPPLVPCPPVVRSAARACSCRVFGRAAGPEARCFSTPHDVRVRAAERCINTRSGCCDARLLSPHVVGLRVHETEGVRSRCVPSCTCVSVSARRRAVSVPRGMKPFETAERRVV